MKNKKIALVAHEGHLTGANRALLEYAQILKKEGCEILFILPSKGTLISCAQRNGFLCFVVPSYSWAKSLERKDTKINFVRWALRNIIATFKIREILKNNNCTHCVTNTQAVIVGAVAAKLAKVTHFWLVHEFGEEDHGFKLFFGQSRAYKIMSHLSLKIVVNSKAVLNKFSKHVDSKKMSILYNAISPPSSYAIVESFSPPHFLILGQIAPGKGHLDAVCAWNKLRKSSFEGVLHIVGSCEQPDYLAEIKDLINENNLSEWIKILPPVDDVYEILPKYKALLMCSRNEAFGRVTVEALYSGIPVVAAESGGSLEIVQDGKNGLLYKVGDYNGLALKIRSLLDENVYMNLKKNTILSVANRFNFGVTRQQLLDLLRCDE
jgi:glycosyltransferase involved in cell wall biosynthesis